ncbi:hypothetical protein [Candidatus Babela massiliensis]|uniref:Beta-propeller domain fused to N-terminal C-rich domain n=1 Tax=Candidatus Babela massiliensis TaxID=673862 RepID=V6DG46_9BACT|nr:hypothetical protein [Candidatus Babela massiliensis]CDK30572.1 Beta-propeller domain fused to N-terminal C-rich domain [Candidatus Babela massiliensis]
MVRLKYLKKSLLFLMIFNIILIKDVKAYISQSSTEFPEAENINKSNCNTDCSNECGYGCSNDYASSRTIFIPRLLTTNSMLDLPLGNYQFYHNAQCPEDKAFFDIQASYFHLRSRKECELAAYFLPNGRRCISVREDGSGDVGSLWLGLISADGTQFDSRVCLSPRRKVDGGFFNFYFDFNTWLCGTWLSIAFAAMRVEQNICIKESCVENTGTLDNACNATQALNNSEWCAGRFCPNTMVRTGVDDVQFKLGWNYYFCNQDHFGIYFVATAPTGHRTRNLFIFEPLVGTRFGSAGVGFNSDYTVYDFGNQALHWMADLKYRYEFSYCTRRLFDLCKNGPWSRYLLVVSPDQPSMTEPGVNYFARRVRATPRNTVDFWTALHYNCCEYHFEVGYDLYWHQAEKVCLANCENQSLCVGIYDISGDCQGNPVSATCNANISQTVVNAGCNVAPSDPMFVPLSTSDLNLSSGAMPKAMTHTVYGALSYNTEFWCMPLMLGFVGMYEFAHSNTAFEQWGVQVRTSISF